MCVYDNEKNKEEECESYSTEKLFSSNSMVSTQNDMNCVAFYCIHNSWIVWDIVAVYLFWYDAWTFRTHFYLISSCMKQTTISETRVQRRLRRHWRRRRRWRCCICEVSITHSLSHSLMTLDLISHHVCVRQRKEWRRRMLVVFNREAFFFKFDGF